jgi:murein DD-endopeptidase MepM/ murein hydrolase activator NlpD
MMGAESMMRRIHTRVAPLFAAAMVTAVAHFVAGPSTISPASVTQVSVTTTCRVGPAYTPEGVKRFWTRDKRCYSSPWFGGRHRRMIPFGCTRAPYYPASPRCTDGRGFHHGLDLDMPRGTPLYSNVRGRAVTVGIGSAYGAQALIIRSRGRYYLLGHLSVRYVRNGQWVRRGQLVGRAGQNGAPDGPHLHFEVRPAGGVYTQAV